jgi:hypothetical protein
VVPGPEPSKGRGGTGRSEDEHVEPPKTTNARRRRRAGTVAAADTRQPADTMAPPITRMSKRETVASRSLGRPHVAPTKRSVP